MCETLFGQAKECIFAETPLPTGWEPLPHKFNRSGCASKADLHFHVNHRRYLLVAIQSSDMSDGNGQSDRC
jgi:hypothetical protein